MYKIDVGTPSEELISQIKEVLGIDVLNYKHQVDTYAIRHAFKRHRKDLLPITIGDFKLITKTINCHDSLFIDKMKTRTGLYAVKYKKKFDGFTLCYVEEIRTGKKSLMMKTMYKIRNT